MSSSLQSQKKEKKVMSQKDLEELFARATVLLESNDPQKGIYILKNLATSSYEPAIALLAELNKSTQSKQYEKPIEVAKVVHVVERVIEYPHSFGFNLSNIHDIITNFSGIKDGEHLETQTEALIGRVISIREASKKLYFYEFLIDGVKFQIMAQSNHYENPEDFYKIASQIHRGDIIGVRGFIAKTQKGELSLIPFMMKVLTPCLGVIPHSYYGIEDKEIRYNQRYLDMIVNPDVQRIFKLRHKIIWEIRKFLIHEREFIEVETPMMSAMAGGATAKPFKTFHNDLGVEMSMRIAPELYLKQLVIGGLPRVFELGKQFRNEGIDLTHNPEFTSIEAYEVGADYNDLMAMTEQLLKRLSININGGTRSTWMGVEIDFKGPYPRLDVLDTLEEQIKHQHMIPDFQLPSLDFETNSSNTELQFIELLKTLNISMDNPHTLNRILDKLIGIYVEPLSQGKPTFLINHPQIMSPLAKPHRSLPYRTERFELFVNGKELCNAYTELNDPRLQKRIFEQVQKQKTNGDDEIPPSDDSFIQALEIGLPPTGGWGMGIDRLCMMLLNQDSIREVIAFPTRRS